MDYLSTRIELLTSLVKALVDHPEEVSIQQEETTFTTILTIQVSRPDVGRVIGKHGVFMNALRHIVNTGQNSQHKFLVLEVEEGNMRPLPSTTPKHLNYEQAGELLTRAWTFYNRELGFQHSVATLRQRPNKGVLVELQTTGFMRDISQHTFGTLFTPIFVLACGGRLALYIIDARTQLKPTSCYATLGHS